MIARRADAVDRIALGVVPAAAEAHRLAHVEFGDDAGEDAHQLERAPADDRQVFDLFGGDESLARARLGLNQLDLRGDGDRLALLADFEPHVDPAVVVRAEGDRLLLVRLEPAQLDLHVVSAGEDAAQKVLPASVARGRLHGLRARIGQRDRRTRQDAAARVLNGAADGAGGGPLGPCVRRGQQQRDDRPQDDSDCLSRTGSHHDAPPPGLAWRPLPDAAAATS